jgi:hypothetical protein
MANTVANRLRRLSARRELIRAAEHGYITDLRCAMPVCFYPDPNPAPGYYPAPNPEWEGRGHFEHNDGRHPWGPTADHYPELACQGGRLTPDTTRLAHKLCNSEDYWRNPIHAEERARRAVKSAGDHLEEAAANAADEDLVQWEMGMRRWAGTLEPEMRERQLQGIAAWVKRRRAELSADETHCGQQAMED